MGSHGNEGIDFFKLFLLLLLVLGGAGLCVVLFNTFLGKATDKAAELESTAVSAETALYAKYDETIVSGKEVKSCADLYRGRDMAVVVRTVKGGTTTITYGTGLEAPSGTATVAGVFTEVNGRKITGGLKYDDNGLPSLNDDYSTMTKKNSDGYVIDNAKFNAHLLYDTSGTTVIGFFFDQINTATANN